MNILIVKTTPFAPEGITGVICNLYRFMDKKDLHIDVVTPGRAEKKYRDIFTQNGGKVYRIDRSLFRPVRYVRQLKKRIKEGKYDIVHIHGNSRTMALDLLAAKLAGCKVRIAHAHNTDCFYKALHYLMPPLFHSLCTHGFACGEEAGKFLFGKHPYTVVPNGIEVRKFAYNSVSRQSSRARLGLENKLVLCAVGRLSPVKNHSFLLRVLKQLKEKKPNCHLLLLGDGDLRTELQAQAQGLPVTFVGLTDKVEDYLNASDIFVLPSLFEGFPLSAMEAQVSGLICLLADTVTQEVNVSGNCLYLPLEENDWVSALLALDLQLGRSRRSFDAQEAMQRHGYDNVAASAYLRDSYEKTLEKAGE